MRHTKLRLVLSTLALLFAAGCSTMSAGESLPPFDVPDRIALETPMSDPVGEISDPKSIEAVLEITNRYLDNWKTPWGGAPVPCISLIFLCGPENRIGSFGLGRNFVSRGEMNFYSRTISDRHLKALFQLVGGTAFEQCARHNQALPTLQAPSAASAIRRAP